MDLRLTTLINSVREYFDHVERGKSFIIVHKGRPIARIIPFREPRTRKRQIKRVKLKSGIDSSAVLRQLRDEEGTC